MSAAPTHLAKLDRIQSAAERIGGFNTESPESRRDASLIGLIFKLLDGCGRGQLNDYTPTVVDVIPEKVNRNTTTGLQIIDQTNSRSLIAFERGIVGRSSKVWKKIPQHILRSGNEAGWQTITKACQRFLTGKSKPTETIMNDPQCEQNDHDQFIKSTIYT